MQYFDKTRCEYLLGLAGLRLKDRAVLASRPYPLRNLADDAVLADARYSWKLAQAKTCESCSTDELAKSIRMKAAEQYGFRERSISQVCRE